MYLHIFAGIIAFLLYTNGSFKSLLVFNVCFFMKLFANLVVFECFFSFIVNFLNVYYLIFLIFIFLDLLSSTGRYEDFCKVVYFCYTLPWG